jgi:hypothetical protein
MLGLGRRDNAVGTEYEAGKTALMSAARSWRDEPFARNRRVTHKGLKAFVAITRKELGLRISC